jgi:hypothetical protein
VSNWRGPIRAAAASAVAAALLSLAPAPALAQAADDPNPGALTFTGAFDVPSLYVFRGIVQEADPKFTTQPYGDIGIALFSGEGALTSAGVNFGVWNSLHTGSSGSDGSSGRVHYEEDFYTTLSLGFAGGVTWGTTFTAYTSPNGVFNTVKELSFKFSKAHMINPYGVLAFELSDDGQADAGSSKGTYLELGVGPSFTLVADGPTLTIPVKIGMSLKDYYEAGDTDNKFGFFDIGAQVTIPFKGVPSRFGAWNLHGGADVLVFGDTTKLSNDGNTSKVVGLIGIGVAY